MLPPDFTIAGHTFVSVWLGDHYIRKSTCGRIVARRSEGLATHEVAVDGATCRTGLPSMRGALLAGVTELSFLRRGS